MEPVNQINQNSNNSNAPIASRKRKRDATHINLNVAFDKPIMRNFFTQLPHELILHICTFLSPSDVTRLETTCSSLNCGSSGNNTHNYWAFLKKQRHFNLAWESPSMLQCGRHCMHKLEYAINSVMPELANENMIKPLTEIIYKNFLNFKWIKNSRIGPINDSTPLTAELIFSVTKPNKRFFCANYIAHMPDDKAKEKAEQIKSILSHPKVTAYAVNMLSYLFINCPKEKFKLSNLKSEFEQIIFKLKMKIPKHLSLYFDDDIRFRYEMSVDGANDKEFACSLASEISEYIKIKFTLADTVQKETDILTKLTGLRKGFYGWRKILKPIYVEFDFNSEIQWLQMLHICKLHEHKYYCFSQNILDDLQMYCDLRLRTPEFKKNNAIVNGKIFGIEQKSPFFIKNGDKGIKRGTEVLIEAGKVLFHMGKWNASQQILEHTESSWQKMPWESITCYKMCLDMALKFNDFAKAEKYFWYWLNTVDNDKNVGAEQINMACTVTSIANTINHINLRICKWKSIDFLSEIFYNNLSKRCVIIDSQESLIISKKLISEYIILASHQLKDWKKVVDIWKQTLAPLGGTKDLTVIASVADAAGKVEGNSDLAMGMLTSLKDKILENFEVFKNSATTAQTPPQLPAYSVEAHKEKSEANTRKEIKK